MNCALKCRWIALALILVVLLSCNAYALPSDLYVDTDHRIETAFALENQNGSISWDIFQKLMAHLQLIDTKQRFVPKDRVSFANYVTCIGMLSGISPEGKNAFALCSELYQHGLVNVAAAKKDVTFDDMIYSMVKIGGFYQTAEASGGHAAAYMVAAKSNGLLKGVNYRSGQVLTNAEFSQLVFNLLTCTSNAVALVDGADFTYRAAGETLLERQFDITFVRGVLNGAYYTNMYDGMPLAQGCVEINRVRYFCEDENTSAYIGYEVAGFVENGSRKNLLFFEPTAKNQTLEAAFEDVLAFDETSIKYADENGRTKVIGLSAVPVIYNGVLNGIYSSEMIKRLDISNAGFIFIDNDGDDRYDLVRIWDERHYVIKYDSGHTNKLFFDFDMKLDGAGFLDVESTDEYVVEILKNGSRIQPSDVLSGNVVSIARSANTNGVKYVRVSVANQRMKVNFSSVSMDQHFVVSQSGQAYHIAPTFMKELGFYGDAANPKAEYPYPGVEYYAYLNVQGEIVFLTKEGNYDVGYVMAYYLGKDTIKQPEAKIALFTLDAKRLELALAPKVTLYAEEFIEGKKMEREDAIAEYAKRYPGDPGSLIKYRQNEAGEICDIYLTVNRHGQEPGSLDYPMTLDYAPDTSSKIQRYYGSVLRCEERYVYRADSSVRVIEVPPLEYRAQENYYKIYPVTSKGNDYNYNDLSIYACDDFSRVGLCVVQLRDIASQSASKTIQSCLVDKLVQGLDDEGAPRYKLYYWCEGKYTYCYVDDIALTDVSGEKWRNDIRIGDLKQGDVCQFETNVAQELVSFRVLLLGSNRGDYRVHSGDGALTDSCTFETQGIYYGKVIGVKGDMVKLDLGGRTETNPVQVTENRYIYIFDSKIHKITLGTLADIAPEDEVLGRKRYHAFWDIVIYR